MTTPDDLRTLAEEIHTETRKVFAEIDGLTSPHQAAQQAADYFLESLLQRLRALAAAQGTQEAHPLQHLADQQVDLSPEVAKVLHDNLHNLYEGTQEARPAMERSHAAQEG